MRKKDQELLGLLASIALVAGGSSSLVGRALVAGGSSLSGGQGSGSWWLLPLLWAGLW